MKLSEIVTAVQRQFGDESGAQITRADIVRWANDAQVDIIRKTEALQQHSETDSIKDDGSYDLPTDFIRARRVTYDGRVLKRVTLEELDGVDRTREATIRTGTPEMYYIWADSLHLYPKPTEDGSGNLDIYYLRRPAVLSGDNDVPEIPVFMHEDMVRYCLARAKELDEEDGKAESVMADYEYRLMQSREEIFSPDIDAYSAVRALPGDDGGFW